MPLAAICSAGEEKESAFGWECVVAKIEKSAQEYIIRRGMHFLVCACVHGVIHQSMIKSLYFLPLFLFFEIETGILVRQRKKKCFV